MRSGEPGLIDEEKLIANVVVKPTSSSSGGSE
jgi:hypothetical protein